MREKIGNEEGHVSRVRTHLGLCRRIKHFAPDEEGDVVLLFVLEEIVCHLDKLQCLDIEARLLQSLALCTLKIILAIFEVATWELVPTCEKGLISTSA